MRAASRWPVVASVTNVVYGSVLVSLAVTPSVPVLPEGFSDLHAHAVAYGLEAVLLYWLASSWFAAPASASLAWLGANGFGVCTEILQRLDPARASEARDLAADLFGVTLAVVALLLARRAPGLWRSPGQTTGEEPAVPPDPR